MASKSCATIQLKVSSTMFQYDLRSPLTNISLHSAFLDDPATGPLNGKQREYAG